MYRLHDHSKRTVSAHPTLETAIGVAKTLWPGCLILVGAGPDVVGSTVCIYEDLEDLCDERAIGEITGDVS